MISAPTWGTPVAEAYRAGDLHRTLDSAVGQRRRPRLRPWKTGSAYCSRSERRPSHPRRPARGRGARPSPRGRTTRGPHCPAPGRARPTRPRSGRGGVALPPPALRVGGRRPRGAPPRHDRHRLGEDARLQPPGARLARTSATKPRALPLSHEGARPGSVPDAERAARAEAAAGDLRRRHADRAAVADPQVGERDPDEPGHGPHRPPAEPRALGRRAREPALRRPRRGACLPRDLRLPRGERDPPAAADRADLRLGSAVPARYGHDREPRRARRAAPRRRR